jgi:SEC-C motif
MNITTATPGTITPDFSPEFPSPVLTRAATLLDDPLIIDWALRYFEHPSRTQDEKKQLTTLWFTPNQMSAFFATNNSDHLFRLLQALPPEHFLPWTTQLISCWKGIALDLCLAAAKTLSHADPILAAQTFEAYLNSDEQIRVEVFLSIAINLQYLPAANQVAMLETMLATPKPEKGQSGEKIWARWAEDIYRALFKAALQNQHAALPELFQLILIQEQDLALWENQENNTISWLAMEILGDFSWANVFLSDWEEDVLIHNLVTLLEDTAPITEIVEVFKTESDQDATSTALALLGQHHTRLPGASTCWKLLQSCDIKPWPLTSRTLALAAVASAFERKTLDTDNATLAQLTAWLALDFATSRHYAALTQQIGHFPKAEIITAVRTQFELIEKNSSGHTALLRFIGELGWPEFIPQLLTILTRNDDNNDNGDADEFADENEDLFDDSNDWLYHAAIIALTKITDAGSVLIRAWEKLDRSQQKLACYVLKFSKAADIVPFLLSHMETMIRKDNDLWYELTLMNPDLRLLEQLKTFLPKNNLMVEHCFYCACRLLNIAHPRLKEIQHTFSARFRTEAWFKHLSETSHLTSNHDQPRPLLPWEEPIDVISRPTQVINESKIGRNDPCPCGSGKKYKKCCMP